MKSAKKMASQEVAMENTLSVSSLMLCSLYESIFLSLAI